MDDPMMSPVFFFPPRQIFFLIFTSKFQNFKAKIYKFANVQCWKSNSLPIENFVRVISVYHGHFKPFSACCRRGIFTKED